MPPVVRFCLTLAGTLLFGWPLWVMLHDSHTPHPREAASAPPLQKTIAPAVLTVRFTGSPDHLHIYRGAERVASLPPNERSPWETDIALPESARAFHLRVEATWAAPGAQAVTLELEPERRQGRDATRWAHGRGLNDIFSFAW